MYTTKATWLGSQYGCRVFKDGKPCLEGRAETRQEIGAVFRDLFRTLDKMGGDRFTSAARIRKWDEFNLVKSVKHIWL